MNKMQGVAYYEKVPIIYEDVDGKIHCYDGDNYGFITQEQRKQMRSLRTDFILVKRGKRDKRPLKDIHEEFIKVADEMKKETNGLVNMYKTGTDPQTAINLAFHFLNKNDVYAEPISMEEARFIKEASQGPLLFGTKYKGPAWKRDINSSYASIYSNDKFYIPIKQGEFKTMSKEEFKDIIASNEKWFSYGIYRATLKYPDEEKPYWKVFKQNRRNYYTHIELNYAKKKGMKLELIVDGKPNFLHYSIDKLKAGSKCFKEFVDLLYPLRKRNEIVEGTCKSLLAKLWGALCQLDEYHLIKRFDEDFEVPEYNEVISGPTILDDNRYEVVMVRKGKPFQTNWARLKPFILAKGRVNIAEYIYPYMENVKRCHTDGIVLDIEPKFKTSKELGGLKDEGYCEDCEVFNAQKMTGLFE